MATKTKIGQDLIDRKNAGLISPRDSKDFERFVKERRQKKMKEEEEKNLSSRMPEEREPTDDAMANDRAKLAEEKSAYSNKRQQNMQDIEAEENE